MSQMPPPIIAPGVPPPYEPGVGTFDLSTALRRGWELVQAQYGAVLVSVVVFVGIWLGAILVSAFIPFLGSFAGVFVAPIAVSLGFSFVLRLRGVALQGTDIFRGLKERYWYLVVIQLLVSLITMAAAIPLVIGVLIAIALGAATGSAAVGIVVGVPLVLAGLVVVWYVGARLSLAGLLFMDAPPGSLDLFAALKMSWARTGPHAWGLVMLNIVISLLNAVCAFLLLVPLILLGIPMQYAAWGAAYDMLCPAKFSGRCPSCGYDCTSVPENVCPECGKAFERDQAWTGGAGAPGVGG
jgi:hypothetical protein